MHRLAYSPLFLFLCPSLVSGAFQDFAFAGNKGNETNPNYECGNTQAQCEPPLVCVYDAVTDLNYCCQNGPGSVCLNGADVCGANNGTDPNSSQQLCSTGGSNYCCLKDRETCTQQLGQSSICWSTMDNPIADIPASRLNETFSSLSSASPSATFYTIDTAALFATTSSASSSSPASSTDAAPPADSDSGGLSGGAIAGIVVGVVGGLALIAGIVVFLLWRRKKNTGSANATAAQENTNAGYGYQQPPQAPPMDNYNPNAGYYQPPPQASQTEAYDTKQAPPYNTYAKRNEASELPASQTAGQSNETYEMSAN